MKTIIFYLLLIPILGMGQPERESMNSFRGETFNIKEVSFKPIEEYSFKSIVHPLVSSNLNLADENKMLLDSFYLYYFDYSSDTTTIIREYYEYDNHGNRSLFAEYIPCETCAVGTNKIESFYDEDGHLSMEMFFYWDYTKRQWWNGRKEIYTYSLNGSIITISYYLWDVDNGLWQDHFKKDISYDEQGNIISEISSRYDANTSIWIVTSKNEYGYKNGKRTMQIFFQWDEETSQLINNSKEEFEFDANGNETVINHYYWEKSTNQWFNNYRHIKAYSQEGKMTNYTQSRWDAPSTQWMNVNKEDYTFNSNGNEILKLYWEWNSATNEWIGNWKIENTYNEKGLLATRITNWWYLNEWNPRDKEYFEYDPEGNIILINSYHWRLADKVWYISKKYNYYYSLHELTNAVDVKETQLVKIYPNPVKETFTLEINDRSVTQCQIFNSNGHLLQTLPVQMGVNTINISNLKEGLYLINIKTGKGTIIKKIIKN